MQYAYLILGSNLGDSKLQLQKACILIEQYCGLIVKSSALYQTAAWGKTDEPNFVNQVVMLQTTLTPQALLKQLLSIETMMGRVRTTKYASRTIDIDILFYGNLVINEAGLTIPHPHIASRRFVLVPLAAIVPNKIHPVYKKSVKKLLELCDDTLAVSLIN